MDTVKMAYYYTRAAMAMVDVSLLYSELTVKAEDGGGTFSS